MRGLRPGDLEPLLADGTVVLEAEGSGWKAVWHRDGGAVESRPKPDRYRALQSLLGVVWALPGAEEELRRSLAARATSVRPTGLGAVLDARRMAVLADLGLVRVRCRRDGWSAELALPGVPVRVAGCRRRKAALGALAQAVRRAPGVEDAVRRWWAERFSSPRATGASASETANSWWARHFPSELLERRLERWRHLVQVLETVREWQKAGRIPESAEVVAAVERLARLRPPGDRTLAAVEAGLVGPARGVEVPWDDPEKALAAVRGPRAENLPRVWSGSRKGRWMSPVHPDVPAVEDDYGEESEP